MTIQTDDRRGFIRVPLDTRAEVLVQGQTFRAGEEIDLSMSGVRLSVSGAPPAPGSACRVRIQLPTAGDRVVIEAEGTVIRSVPGSLAIEFTDLDPDSYFHLKNLILNNASDPEQAEQEFTSHWGIRPARP